MKIVFKILRMEKSEYEGRKLHTLLLQLDGTGAKDPIKVYVSETDWNSVDTDTKFEFESARPVKQGA